MAIRSSPVRRLGDVSEGEQPRRSERQRQIGAPPIRSTEPIHRSIFHPMSFSNWRSYAAVAGCIAALFGLMLVGQWVAGGERIDRKGHAGESNRAAGSENSSIAPFPYRGIDGPGYEPNCNAPKDHDESDECAQRSMARSAWKTVKLTRAQTAIGAAGLAGLMVTLVLSLVAVRESRRSTEIAERALVAGHRAFVFASGINPQWEINAITSEYNWRIRPIWQNSGETPTRRLRLVADCVGQQLWLAPVRCRQVQLSRPQTLSRRRWQAIYLPLGMGAILRCFPRYTRTRD
jgi:hypothetical protein